MTGNSWYFDETNKTTNPEKVRNNITIFAKYSLVNTYGGDNVSLTAYHGIGTAKFDPFPTANWRIRAGFHRKGTGVCNHDALYGTDPETPTLAACCLSGGDRGNIVGA